MKFLIIAQDLRISGTSEGIVSRSFIAKLRTAYPESVIDVVYLKRYQSNDRLDLLPVDSIEEHILSIKVPFFTNWLNKIYWRLFHFSLTKNYIDKVYGSYIANINYNKYCHIFIRSSGLDYETILGAKGLPILKKSIVNFHDPYPLFWYAGSKNELTNLELFKLKEMFDVVNQAKTCMSSASLMSEDMQSLYGCRKYFHHLPHQYDENVFDLSDVKDVLKKNKKVTISYHGAVQFGRNADVLLDAYEELLNKNNLFKEDTEFILRLNGQQNQRLRDKYSKIENISILDTSSFSNSCYEQMNESDINIILENGPLYCNIMVGKAPFLASIKKPILCISPERSEMRRIIKNDKYIASCADKEEIKQKLEWLILNRMESNEEIHSCGNYFSDENFKLMLDKVLFECKEQLPINQND